MTNEFVVDASEIMLVDESEFLATGGEELWFGTIDGSTVHLHATGSRAAICCLARKIIDHKTASH